MSRPSRDEYGLQLARTVALRADCTRRQVGAVIIDQEGRIVSTGYNGAPAGEPGCLTAGACPRGQLTYAQQAGGAAYEAGESRCVALHAEINAVVYAGRERCKGSTIYVTDEPCYLCALVIKAAGIDRVIHAGDSGIRPEALGSPAPAFNEGPLDPELVAALQRAVQRREGRQVACTCPVTDLDLEPHGVGCPRWGMSTA